MKRIFVLIFSAMLILTVLCVGVSADRTLPLVVDNAELLDTFDEAALVETLESICESRGIEIAIVTVNSTDGKSAMAYADDFYDENGYGAGIGDDGVLLLIDMGNREWWITTHGLGQSYLSDYALARLEDAFLDDLSSGYYYEAFQTFALTCDEYIAAAISGNPVTEDDYYGDDKVITLSYFLPSLVVGFIIALIIVTTMKHGMTTVRSASGAANYMVNGSLSLRSQSDHYLYSNTVRTRRDTDNNGGRSGTSSHRSSSGRSHGGRGGRF